MFDVLHCTCWIYWIKLRWTVWYFNIILTNGVINILPPNISMWFSPPCVNHFPNRKPARFSTSKRLAQGIQNKPCGTRYTPNCNLIGENNETSMINPKEFWWPASQTNFCWSSSVPTKISHNQSEKHMLQAFEFSVGEQNYRGAAGGWWISPESATTLPHETWIYKRGSYWSGSNTLFAVSDRCIYPSIDLSVYLPVCLSNLVQSLFIWSYLLL